MSQEYSQFSLSGLGWLEERANEGAVFHAQRAAEDAEIAQRRFEEDAALAVQRAQQDSERAQREQHESGQWVSEREASEAALHHKWRLRMSELSASLDEAVAAHMAELALDKQRQREMEAEAQAQAARAAAAVAQEAGRETEAMQLALRQAELHKLRLSAQPSLRAFLLVDASQIPFALQVCSLVRLPGTGCTSARSAPTPCTKAHAHEA